MVLVQFLRLLFAIHFGVVRLGGADSDLAVLSESSLDFELGGADYLELQSDFVIGMNCPGETLFVLVGVEGERDRRGWEEEEETEEEGFHRLYDECQIDI